MASNKQVLSCDVIKRTLENGEKYPYDSDQPSTDWAHKAARGVIADLSDRGGIKHQFGQVDQEIRIEIVETLAAIIRLAALADQPSDKAEQEPVALGKLKVKHETVTGFSFADAVPGLLDGEHDIFIFSPKRTTNTASKESAQVALSDRERYENWLLGIGYDPVRVDGFSYLAYSAWQEATRQARSQVQRDGWQPIETAPKDGTCVLVAQGQYMAVAFADPENDFCWTLDDGHDYLPCLRRELANPTHWMPLPFDK